MGDRGWAAQLLSWRWRGMRLEGEMARCRYFVRPVSGEVIAWGELRDVSGGRPLEVGSFANVGAARAACEADAQRRVQREAEERAPVDVRISRGRRRVRGGLSTVGPSPGN